MNDAALLDSLHAALRNPDLGFQFDASPQGTDLAGEGDRDKIVVVIGPVLRQFWRVDQHVTHAILNEPAGIDGNAALPVTRTIPAMKLKPGLTFLRRGRQPSTQERSSRNQNPWQVHFTSRRMLIVRAKSPA